MRFSTVLLLMAGSFVVGVFAKQVGWGIAWIWSKAFPPKP